MNVDMRNNYYNSAQTYSIMFSRQSKYRTMCYFSIEVNHLIVRTVAQKHSVNNNTVL